MRYLVLSLGLVLAACSPQQKNQLKAEGQRGIMGGKLVPENTPIGSMVVGIYDRSTHSTCTATLLSENTVLTAAHCAYGVRPHELEIIFDHDIMAVLSTSEQDVKAERIRQVTAMKIHQKYNPDMQEEDPFDWADLAVLKFSGKIPEGYKFATLLKDRKTLKTGTELVLAGFGVDSVNTYPVNPKKVKNLSEAIELGDVVCDDGRKYCEEVVMSGDGELKFAKAPISLVVRSEIRVDESKGQGTCSGDSGGPAFLEVDGQLAVAGITSRGAGLCDGVGIYTNVPYYWDWIEDAVEGFK